MTTRPANFSGWLLEHSDRKPVFMGSGLFAFAKPRNDEEVQAPIRTLRNMAQTRAAAGL
jgi:hypothetical protein